MSPKAPQSFHHQFRDPWHVRQPQFEDERRYFRLLSIHQMTQRWMKEISRKDELGFQMERTARPVLNQNLWLLEKIKLDELPPRLEDLIDATEVKEFLADLEDLIWIVQSSTLENMLVGSKEPVSLINVLEKASWQAGRAYAEERWPQFEAQRFTDYFDALAMNPIADRSDLKPAFILERESSSECSIYWKSSPQDRPSILRSPAVLTHCRLYHEWIRGFIYSLSREVKVEILATLLGGQNTWKIILSRF